MSFAAANIRTAIEELLEGDIGTTRTVAAGVFLADTFEQDAAKAALVVDAATAPNRFDVEFGEMRAHEATPLAMANKRIEQLDVTIRVWKHLHTTVEKTRRRTDKAALESALDDAILALAWPGNLTQTAAAGATNIISGRMEGRSSSRPERPAIVEDWAAHRMSAEIQGRVLLHLTD